MINDLINLPYSLDFVDFLEKKEALSNYLKDSKVDLYILNRFPSNHQIFGPHEMKPPYYEFQNVRYNLQNNAYQSWPSEFELVKGLSRFKVKLAHEGLFSEIKTISNLEQSIMVCIEVVIERLSSRVNEEHLEKFYEFTISEEEIDLLEELSLLRIKNWTDYTFPSRSNDIVSINNVLQCVEKALQITKFKKHPCFSIFEPLIKSTIEKMKKERNLIYFLNLSNFIEAFFNDSTFVFEI